MVKGPDLVKGVVKGRMGLGRVLGLLDMPSASEQPLWVLHYRLTVKAFSNQFGIGTISSEQRRALLLGLLAVPGLSATAAGMVE